MYYYNHEQYEQMKKKAWNWKLEGILEKYFGDRTKWGANVLFDENGNADTIELCKLSYVTVNGETWTHYATIGLYKSHQESEDEYWEVYSQFNGDKEDELWIFGYYKNFGDAVRRVRLGIEKLKPIKKY